jgi:uncharacterized protein (TIGR00299 family) protein
MTRIAYFDCFSGISGNMSLGALMDCGASPDQLRRELAKLNLPGWRLETDEVRKAGLRGLHAHVAVGEKQPARHLSDIERIIAESGLSEQVKSRGQSIFRRLAEAESRVHGEPVQEIHFHEVGAVDAIVDIVGTCIALDLLGVGAVYGSPVHIGTGTVESAHGVLPVPAPATLELLKGIPVYGRDVEAELVTPTGAAILAALAAGFGDSPPMRVAATGYGAGTRDLPWANLLRATIGEAEVPGGPGGRVLVVEANIDDMNPEWYENAMERLFEAGALDVYLIPIQMKRSRPAVVLTLLVEEDKLAPAIDVLFAETTTIGVRMHEVRRETLGRDQITVETPFGPIQVKIARRAGRVMNAAPEYRDCVRVAREKKVPLKEVYRAAMDAAGRLGPSPRDS